jgi:MFS family permease
VERDTAVNLHLHRWSDGPLLAVAWISFASGVGQFGAVAALGDVARTFGHVVSGTTIADQAGLSGTALGLGLACIRLASLGALPLAALADRLGRRVVLLAVSAVGLTITLLAAASPGYWWFVVIFATGRPLLSAANSLCSVIAAEETASKERAKAMALIAATYGIGAGITAIIHSLAGSAVGFRGICLLAAVPLATLPFVARKIEEPVRFSGLSRTTATEALFGVSSDDGAPGGRSPTEAVTKRRFSLLAATRRPYRGRLFIVALLAFFLSMVTGPANTFVFLFAQNVVHLSGTVTAMMVVCAGVTGFGGLLVGRWSADKFGRRPTAAIAMMVVSVLGVVTYGGSKAGLFLGYIIAVGIAAILAPAAGSLVNEMFPTEVRASVGGWQVAAGVIGAATGLVVFGEVADIGNRFAIAAAVTFLPSILVALAFWLLPETMGKEPEDLWPEDRFSV